MQFDQPGSKPFFKEAKSEPSSMCLRTKVTVLGCAFYHIKRKNSSSSENYLSYDGN